MFRFLGRVSSGSTIPIIIETESEKFFAKFAAGFSGSHSFFTEFYISGWLKSCGFPVQEFNLLQLPHDFERQLIDPELKDLFRKSNGWILYTPYRENNSGTKTPLTNYPELRQIFILDLFLMNIDRSLSNPNILYSDGGQLFIDWESCLLINNLLEGKDSHWKSELLPILRNNPLFIENLDVPDVQLVKGKLYNGLMIWTKTEKSMIQYCEFFPPVPTISSLLIEKFHIIFNVETAILSWQTARTIIPESEISRNHRIRGNRDSFIRELN